MNLAQTSEDAERIIRMIREEKEFGFDSESSGPLLVKERNEKKRMVNVYRSSLTGVSFWFDVAGGNPESRGSGWYVPCGHREGSNVPCRAMSALLKALSETEAIVWAHNWKHEIKALRTWDNGHGLFMGDSGRQVYLPKRAACSMVLCWMLGYPSESGRYNLKGLSPFHLGLELTDFETTVGSARSFDHLTPEMGTEYAVEDAYASFLLGRKFYPELVELGLDKAFWEMEMPFTRVLSYMEDCGVELDYDWFAAAKDELKPIVDSIELEWEELVGGNIRSGKQLNELLYETGMWITDGVKRTKTGFATDKDAVALQLAYLDPGSPGYRAAVLKKRYSAANKILSTYTDSLLRRADQYPDGRLHIQFHQTGTTTGRLSAGFLHQLPKEVEGIPFVRNGIIAAPGYKLTGSDYSQVELRMLGHYAPEGSIAKAFRSGSTDIHQSTADLMGCTRNQGKTCNFATTFGAGIRKISQGLGVTTKEGKEFMDRYFSVHYEIKPLQERVWSAGERGYVKTFGGRIRRIPELYETRNHHHNQWGCEDCNKKYSGRRKAFNAVLQGGARDVIAMGMIRYFNLLQEKNYLGTIKLLGQVHDELVTSAPEELVKENEEMLQDAMVNAVSLNVPLVAEPVSAYRWGDLK